LRDEFTCYYQFLDFERRMNFLPVSDNAARQAIDAATIWTEYLHAQAAAKPYAGGMYWKKEGAYEYLVKTLAGKKQQRLGPRTPETEQVLASFHARKKSTEARLSSLASALDEAQRQNKALRAGRTPDIVVRLLNALREAGLERHFRVVGTHAIYAYESAAGVRITQGALATQDVDLLWDASRRVEFLADLQRDVGSVLALLQKVDPSFERRDDALKNESAINDKGFEVEFLRREIEPGDVHPFRFSDNENDLWPVQARRAAVLAQSPLFMQPVISATGKMATMNTVDPRTFVEFKRWMAGLEGRAAIKRRRDALQADVVQELLESKLLTSTLD
jgi:hypothetical protein